MAAFSTLLFLSCCCVAFGAVSTAAFVGPPTTKTRTASCRTFLVARVPYHAMTPTTSESSKGTQDTNDNNHRDLPNRAKLPPGATEGFYVVQEYYPATGTLDDDIVFDLSMFLSPLLRNSNPDNGTEEEKEDSTSTIQRLQLSPTNVTLPIALMLANPQEFPTQSRARKACRQKKIVIYRKGSSGDDARAEPRLGRVADRCQPGDVLGRQERLLNMDDSDADETGDYKYSKNAYAQFIGAGRPPPFDLPVIYQDDHIAIVNKPAGVPIYDVYYDDSSSSGTNGKKKKRKNSRHGLNTILYALPHVLRPPTDSSSTGTCADNNYNTQSLPIRRPVPCHRLDMPTSGLLVCAKTYEAAVHLTRQFEQRLVRKTYTAIVNGRLPKVMMDKNGNQDETTISSQEAEAMGVDVTVMEDVDSVDDYTTIRWRVVDAPQEGKTAVTIWRELRHSPSVAARDGWLTLVELKPKTGRKHQLRRHMAWVYDTPIAGDTLYGKANDNSKRWGRGLMLCSNRIEFQHPFYNATSFFSKMEFKEKMGIDDNIIVGGEDFKWSLTPTTNGTVIVGASIALPKKFTAFLATEEKRAAYAKSS